MENLKTTSKDSSEIKTFSQLHSQLKEELQKQGISVEVKEMQSQPTNNYGVIFKK